MKNRRIVAVVGISGVGKSTALARAQVSLTFTHLQASALIKAEHELRQQKFVDHDTLREANIDDNQTLLIDGFHRAVPDSGLVVLDGHTIIDTPIGLVEVESSVFRQIGASRIIVLTEEPEKIWQRRPSDSQRMRPMRSIDELRRQQDCSLVAARRAALELRIPLVISDNVQDLVAALQ